MARPKKTEMSPAELDAMRAPGAAFVADAKARLGHMWGLGRELTNSELGRALKLSEETWPGSHISKLISKKATLTGPIEVAIGMMLDGGVPRSMAGVVKPGYPRTATHEREAAPASN